MFHPAWGVSVCVLRVGVRGWRTFHSGNLWAGLGSFKLAVREERAFRAAL